MSTASNIGIQLTLKGAEQVKQGLKTISGSAAEMARQFEASRGAILTTAAAVATATGIMVDRVSTAAAEIERFAMLAGSTPQEFQRMAAGAKSAGMDMEKYASVMKDTQDKIGDFLQTGGGELKDFFEKIAPAVGVTAEQFKNLSGPQALQLFYNSLEKANLSQKETVFWMESIADDATALQPLLQNNGAAFDALAERAAKYGSVLSDYALAAAKDFKGQTDELTLALQGAEQILAVGLMPTLTETAREMLATADSAGIADGAAAAIRTTLETLVIVASDVAFTFTAVGREIGGMAAQAQAFLSLDFARAGQIRAMMKEDAAGARAELDAFQKRLLNAGQTAKDVFNLSGVMKANKAGTAEYNAALGALIRMKDDGTLSASQYTAAIKGATAASGDLGNAETRTANAAAVAQQRIREEFKSTAEKRNEALDKARKAFGGMIPPDIEKQIREKFKEPLSDSAKAAASSANAVKQAYESAFASAEKQARELVAEEQNLNAAEKALADVMAGEHWGKWNEAQRKAIELIYQRNAATIARQQQEELDAKWASESADANANAAESAYEAANAAEAQRDAQLQANAAIGLTALEVTNLEAARIDDTAAEKQRLAAIMDGIDPAIAADYRRQAQALAELAEAKRTGAVKDAMAETAKEAADEWKRTADKIEDALIDALMNGGKSGAEYIEDLFRTMVLRPVIQAVVSPVAGAVTSALGFGGAAQAGTSSALSSMAGSAMSSSLGTGAFMGAAGAGMNMALSGGMGVALEGGAAMLGSATGLTSAMAGIGQIAGALGPLVLGVGALASVIKGMDNSGTPHTGGAGGYSAARGTFRTNEALGGGDWWNNGYDKTAGGIKGAQELSKILATTLDTAATTFGQKAGYEVWTGFADDASSDPAWSRLFIKNLEGVLVNTDHKFADGEKGQAEYAQYLADATRGVLEGMDLPGWADAMLEGLGDTPTVEQLTQAVAYFADVQAALVNLGDYMPQLANLSEEAASQMMRFFGGAENMVAASVSYYQAFYTEAERTEVATRQLTEALAEIGVDTLPATREAFRALVEAQDLTTESGRETYAALMGLSGAFAALVPVATELSTLLGGLGTAMVDETIAAIDKQIEASTRAGDAARDAAEKYRDAAKSLSDVALEIRYGAADNGTAQAYADTLTKAQGGDLTAMQGLGQSATVMLEQQRGRTSSAAEYAILAAQTANQLQQVSAVADVSASSADYQAMLYDVNTAALEVLKDGLMSGNVTQEFLQKQLDAIEDLGTLISDSAQLTIKAYTDESGLTRTGIFDAGGLMVSSVDTATADQLLALATQTTTLAGSNTTLGGTFTNALSGQTTTINSVGQSQIAALGLVQTEQQKTISATDVVAQVTGENVSLSDAILAQLKTPDASAEYLAKTIGLGNDYIAGRLDGIIAAINQQTAEQQAELKRQQDLTKAQAELEAVALQQKQTVSEVNSAINDIWSLANRYGLTLQANPGESGNTAYFKVNDSGTFEADYDQINGNSRNFGAFKNDFYAAGGVYERTYGRASELSNLAAQLDSYRQTIIDLGGVPAFHTGGYTGPGGKYEAAGVVHRGEVVFSQDDIARLGGVRAVEAIRTGEMPGYATGGTVGGPVVVPAPVIPGRVAMAPRPAASTPDPVQQEREAQARDQAQRDAQQQTQDLIAQLRQVNSNLADLKRSVDKSGQSNDQMNNKIFNMADTTVKLLRKFDALGLPVVDVTQSATEAA